ncbi:MAG: Asp23/Gls24 family envelope stress response protein [Lachnospiraceae bacterium]|nr:Asp23/Gls24 family envelope stress response protein [Lachnospiraceae bacterium]
MKTSMNTHLGSVTISSDVIASFAGGVANECFGVVGMANANMSDGFNRLVKKENLAAGVIVKNNGERLLLEFHLIVAYGVNIKTVTDNLISTVKFKVEEFTGLPVEKINIFVDGVKVID